MRPMFILLYPLSAKWVTRDNNIIYPLETSFPEINLTNNPRNPTKVQFAMDINQILITEYAFRLLKYLNVFTPIYLHTASR